MTVIITQSLVKLRVYEANFIVEDAERIDKEGVVGGETRKGGSHFLCFRTNPPTTSTRLSEIGLTSTRSVHESLGYAMRVPRGYHRIYHESGAKA